MPDVGILSMSGRQMATWVRERACWVRWSPLIDSVSLEKCKGRGGKASGLYSGPFQLEIEGPGRGALMYNYLVVIFFFWFSSWGITILVRVMGFLQDRYVSKLVVSVSRYPWQDSEMPWRKRQTKRGGPQSDTVGTDPFTVNTCYNNFIWKQFIWRQKQQLSMLTNTICQDLLACC